MSTEKDDLIQRSIEEREKANPQNFNIDEQQVSLESQPKVLTLDEIHQQKIDERYKKDEKTGQRLLHNPEDSDIHSAADNFWKNVPLHTLPSKGLFYSDKSEITIRSASVAEVRHWSTIDENDYLDMDDQLNFIIEKCLRIKSEDGISSWKDIKEIDRFYLVFRIHELTFPNGENKLFIKFGCDRSCKGDGSYNKKVQLTSDHLRMFELTDSTLQYYDPNKKCFSRYNEKLQETIEMHVPSIGAMSYVKNIMKDAQKENVYIDKSFLRILPFFVSDWRRINDNSIESLRNKAMGWDMNKFLFISGFIDEFQKSVDLTVKHECERCMTILERPLFFRGGFTIKDLFFISIKPDGLV